MLRKLTLCTCLISLWLFPPAAKAWIKVYQKGGVIYIKGVGEKLFKRPKNAGTIVEKVKHYAKKHGIPERLFMELVRAESNFNTKALSLKGAMGLCQLMPQTAKELGVKDPFDPDENLNGGALYLKRLYLKYRDWKLALAAYNAGESAVEKYGRRVPPYRETRNYVKRIMSMAGKVKGVKVNRKRRYKIVMRQEGDVILISNVWQ